jgi:hypothetical protein
LHAIKEAPPTPIFQTVASLAKGTEILAHELTLLSTQVRIFRAANEALSKCRRAKKTRIRQGGALTIEDAQDVLSQMEAEEQARRDKRSEGAFQKEGQPSRRRCGTCGKSGHNARTCQEAIDTSSLPDSQYF